MKISWNLSHFPLVTFVDLLLPSFHAGSTPSPRRSGLLNTVAICDAKPSAWWCRSALDLADRFIRRFCSDFEGGSSVTWPAIGCITMNHASLVDAVAILNVRCRRSNGRPYRCLPL